MSDGTLYKLTDDLGRARGVQVRTGATLSRAETGPCDPCTARAVHAYTDPLLAVLMDPVHGRYGTSARLWTARMRIVGTDGSKVWGRRMTIGEEIPLPVVTTEQRVRFAILAALTVYDEPGWVAWAHGWLDGTDRTTARAATWPEAAAEAAWAAMWAATWAARAATWAATREAAWAAASAARAAWKYRDVDLAALAHEAVEGSE